MSCALMITMIVEFYTAWDRTINMHIVAFDEV